jgi:hypothetical protein
VCGWRIAKLGDPPANPNLSVQLTIYCVQTWQAKEPGFLFGERSNA